MNKKIFLILLITLIFCSSGCYKEEFSRYPSVEIPQYEQGDYYKLLSNKNNDIVYNAICILGSQAESIGELLSDEKTDPNSKKYKTSLNIYYKILDLLKTRDPKIVSASLRFLQLFSTDYKKTIELIKPLTQIKSNNFQVNFEQITALICIADKNLKLPDSLLYKFLNNRSWIISKNAYLLINKLENEQFRQELISKYKITTDEIEKLLILNALENEFSESVASFLFKEIVTTKNEKIRRKILDILEYAKNKEQVFNWLATNYTSILPSDKQYFFQSHSEYLTDQFSSKTLGIFIEQGFMPNKDFLPMLNQKVEEVYYLNQDSSASKENKEKLNSILEIERSILTNKELSVQWKILRDNTVVKKEELKKISDEYTPIVNDFKLKTSELLIKHNISEVKKDEFLNDIEDIKKSISGVLSENDS